MMTVVVAGNVLAQNDDCSGAISVFNGVNGPFTNVGASTSSPGWQCGPGGADVWFLFTAGAAGVLSADTCGATYDSTIEIFAGSGGCAGLVASAATTTPAACNPRSP